MDKGTCYLVATPIGNLEDITLRALRILKEVDLIAAEDTRNTIKLLNYYEINTPLISYHKHNEKNRASYLITELLNSKNIAIVSDAGMPAISDPGEEIVKECVKQGIYVSVIPGANAALSGLVVSGLPANTFSFEGFISKNNKERKEQLMDICQIEKTIIIYESPHKLITTLKDLIKYCGDREITLAREITKKYEEIWRGDISRAIEHYSLIPPKGEFVLIIKGKNKMERLIEEQKKWEEVSLSEHIDIYIQQGMIHKEAIKKVANDRGVPKRVIYNQVMKK